MHCGGGNLIVLAAICFTRHLVNPVHDLTRNGASINTRTPEGQLVFSIFSALAEFEPTALISERTRVSLASAAHVDARAAVRTR